MKNFGTISLRRLIETVYPVADSLPEEIAAATSINPNFQVVLRTANNTPVRSQQTSGRKYLWVRRTSRRAYNAHMSRMHESLGDISAMPAILIFSSLVGIAFILSILIH
jgi:hypothetical protein